jgi:hypothetical protein
LSTAENDRIARSLGLDAYDPPVTPTLPHPFRCVADNPYCGKCGGGLLHDVHRVDGAQTVIEQPKEYCGRL